MTDEHINCLVLDFLKRRGGYVAAASERELFWLLKSTAAAAEAAAYERAAQACDGMAGGHYMAKICAAAIRKLK